MPVSQPPTGAPKSTSAMGITALVLGVIAFILSFIPIVNNFAIILGIVALVFGIVGIVATKKNGKKKGKGIAIAGTILSVVAIIVSFAMQAAFSSAIDSATKSSASSSQSEEKTPAKKQDNSAAGNDAKKSASEGDLSNAHASIDSATLSGNDYNGKPTVLVTVTWKNTSSTNQMVTTALNPKVYQNGKSLETAIYTSAPQGYDANAILTELKPGASTTATLAYVLADTTTDVEVELSDLLNNNVKLSRTFKIQ